LATPGFKEIGAGIDGSVFLTSNTNSSIYQWSGGTSVSLQSGLGTANTDLAVYNAASVIKLDNSLIYKPGCYSPNTLAVLPEFTSLQITQHAPSTIRIYPNPAQDKVTVQLAEGMEKATITIISALGTTVATDNNTGLQRVINLYGKPSGTYLVRVTTKDGVSTTKKLMVHQ
jgi:hypothetical protein